MIFKLKSLLSCISLTINSRGDLNRESRRFQHLQNQIVSKMGGPDEDQLSQCYSPTITPVLSVFIISMPLVRKGSLSAWRYRLFDCRLIHKFLLNFNWLKFYTNNTVYQTSRSIYCMSCSKNLKLPYRQISSDQNTHFHRRIIRVDKEENQSCNLL